MIVGLDGAAWISIGVWHFFPTLDKYVEELKEMVDIVGVDHVSVLGTKARIPAASHTRVPDGRLFIAALGPLAA